MQSSENIGNESIAFVIDFRNCINNNEVFPNWSTSMEEIYKGILGFVLKQDY